MSVSTPTSPVTFASLTTEIVEGQEVFWERYNDQGGYKGWTVEPVVLDNAYDVPTHLQNYDAFAGDGDDSVVMLTNSTGSPHTAAIAEALVEDDLVAIPLSWYSGWTDPAIGQNVLEVQANYCIEAMNGVTYMSETYGNKMAIASFPGDYGQDGAIGAKIAAEALGLEIVYDGEAAVIPGADQTPVVTGIAESGADLVWLTTGPGQTAEIVGGAAAESGFTGQWAGNSPAWNPATPGYRPRRGISTPPTPTARTPRSGVSVTPRHGHLVATMREYAPDNIADDVYIVWIEGLIAQQVIENAIDNGDITRANMVASANEITVDLPGSRPEPELGRGGETMPSFVAPTWIDVDLAATSPRTAPSPTTTPTVASPSSRVTMSSADGCRLGVHRALLQGFLCLKRLGSRRSTS